MNAEEKQKHYELVQTKGKMEFALGQIKNGKWAKRIGWVMSPDDVASYDASRTYALLLLAKDAESNVADDELISGMEGLIANFVIPEFKG